MSIIFVEGKQAGLDTTNTKIPSYWNTSFRKTCLGMKIDEHVDFIVVNKQANFL